jgi:hypothetical protein
MPATVSPDGDAGLGGLGWCGWPPGSPEPGTLPCPTCSRGRPAGTAGVAPLEVCHGGGPVLRTGHDRGATRHRRPC